MVVVQLTTDNREPFRQYDSTQPWFGSAPDALLEGFAELPNVTVHVVTCTQRPMRSPEKLADNIWFHSLHVPKIGWMRTGYRGCIRAVRHKLRELNPDIVHGQGTERDCSISAVKSGRPNVITIHGNMRLIAAVNRARPLSFYWLAARLERYTIPRSDGVVCITDYTRKAVEALAARTWVIPNAVDRTCFDIQRNESSTPLILCIGVIQARKNQNAYIRALDSLQRELPGWRLLFLGNADQRDPYVREFLDLVNERPWCTYGGNVGRDALKEHLAQATMVALPSLEDNCPMVVLESMAARVPVVAAAVGGVPELVSHERTGLLIDPSSAESMKRETQKLLQNHELRRRLVTNARQEAETRFHPRHVATRHLEVYREVTRRNTAA